MDVLAPGETVSSHETPAVGVSAQGTVTEDSTESKGISMSKGWFGQGQGPSDWVHYQTYLAALIKDAQAAGVLATKDAEANLIGHSDAQFIQVIQDVKDAESRLTARTTDNFIQLVQDVKDAESRLGSVVQGTAAAALLAIKTAETAAALAACKVENTVVQQSNVVQQVVNSNASAAMMFAAQNQTATLIQFKDQAMQLAEVKASFAAQLAACCCELKELVKDDGAETRELINESEQRKLRDRLRHLELAEMVTNKVTQIGAGNIAIPTATATH